MSKLPENCPLCGNRMEKGYLYLSGPSVYWGRKKQLFPKWELIAGKKSAWFRSVIEAHMCRDCGLVLFYGERIQPAETLSEASEGFRAQLLENCPVCGNRVENGYMYVLGPGVYWARRRQRFPKAEHIAGKLSAWTNRSVIESYVCRNCKLVLFYREKMQRARARSLVKRSGVTNSPQIRRTCLLSSKYRHSFMSFSSIRALSAGSSDSLTTDDITVLASPT